MLQDAIWADTERLETDEAYADTAVKFLKAVIKGWVFARDNPEEAAEITLATGSGSGPEPPAVDDERDQQAHLAAPDGIGIIDEAAWDQTVEGAWPPSTRPARTSSPSEPPRPRTATSTSSRRWTSSRRRRHRPARRGVHAARGRTAGGRQLAAAAVDRRRACRGSLDRRRAGRFGGSGIRIRTVRGLTRGRSSDERGP